MSPNSIVGLIACLLLAACGSDEQPQPPVHAVEPADLVLRDGKVVTVDPGLGTQQAIAVRGHTITAVGSNAEITRFIGPRTTVIALDGRLAIPGFIEGHGHFMDFGRARQILDLTGAASWEAILNRVAVAADAAEPGEWIFGRNAVAAVEEDIKDTLTPGKLADITVLSQDILTIAESDIPTTRVDYTIIGGSVGYAR